MKWFSNLKIRTKLLLSFGAIIIMATVLAVIAISQLNTINREYDIIIEGTIARRDSSRVAQSEIRALRRVVAASAMHAARPASEEYEMLRALNALNAEALNMRTIAMNALDDYDFSTNNQPGQNQNWRDVRLGMSRDVRATLEEYWDIFERVQGYARVGDHTRALAYITTNNDTITKLIEQTAAMIEMTTTSMAANTAEVQNTANNAVITVIIIAVAIIITAFVMAITMASVISKPIQNLVRLAKDVVAGKLNINMNRDILTRDEIGDLTWDIYNVVDTIKNLVEDVEAFSHEINANGDLDYRINISNYQGGYAEMAESLNSFADIFISDMVNIIEILKKVGDGDFNLKLDRLPGKKIIINEATDNLKTNLDAVIGEVGGMISAAAEKGQLSFKIDTAKYKGGWGEIMEGLNDIASAVDAPLSEIRNVMGNLSKGDFSKSVTGDYAGDFKQIKDAVNTTIMTLSVYINEIKDSLAAMSDGDLTNRISREYVGNFSAIKESLNNISETLNTTMSKISAATSQVFSGAKQIANSAQALANGAQQQASSLEELNATIDTIDQQTQQNAENAQTANKLSEVSTANARQGSDSMTQMVNAMEEINQSSNAVTGIVGTIQNIAFQTNLLALNASVEAARAGEHGKGFSVVADEVRTLAGRSQVSAEETTKLIQESIQQVESGTAIAEATSVSLETIVANATEVAEIISGITIASKEQAEAVSQVTQGLELISKVVQDNSAVSEETAASSQELSSQAEILQQLVSFFRL